MNGHSRNSGETSDDETNTRSPSGASAYDLRAAKEQARHGISEAGTSGMSASTPVPVFGSSSACPCSVVALVHLARISSASRVFVCSSFAHSGMLHACCSTASACQRAGVPRQLPHRCASSDPIDGPDQVHAEPKVSGDRRPATQVFFLYPVSSPRFGMCGPRMARKLCALAISDGREEVDVVCVIILPPSHLFPER